MEDLLEILKYILPSIIVFITALFIMKRFMDNEYRKLMLEVRKNHHKTTTPLRLQAYERFILFLERISPNNLVTRVHKPGMSAQLLQSSLITTVKKEFEHNLTQQIYVSSSSWQTIKKAKDDVIKIINMAASQLPEDASGVDLGKKIFEIVVQTELSPTKLAVEVIKKEIQIFF